MRTGTYPSGKQEGHRHGTLAAALAVRGDPPRLPIFSPAGPALCSPPPRRPPAVVLRSVGQLASAGLFYPRGDERAWPATDNDAGHRAGAPGAPPDVLACPPCSRLRLRCGPAARGPDDAGDAPAPAAGRARRAGPVERGRWQPLAGLAAPGRGPGAGRAASGRQEAWGLCGPAARGPAMCRSRRAAGRRGPSGGAWGSPAASMSSIRARVTLAGCRTCTPCRAAWLGRGQDNAAYEGQEERPRASAVGHAGVVRDAIRRRVGTARRCGREPDQS